MKLFKYQFPKTAHFNIHSLVLPHITGFLNLKLIHTDEALQIEGELMGEAKNKDAITLIDPIEGTHYEHNVIDDIPDLSVEETVAMNEPTEPKVSFAKLSETKPGESVIMMDYGSSGSGKTEFHGTGGSRAFIIDTGDGLETLRAPGFHSRHPNSDPTIARVAEKLGQRGNITTATAFDAVCDIIDFAMEKINDQWDVLIIDDVTALRKFAMNKGLEVGQKLGKSQTLAKAKEFDATFFAVQDYGAEMDLINKFVAGYTSIFREKKKHLVMGCHERITLVPPRDNQGKVIIGGEMVIKDVRPGFTGKTFPDDIVAYFDEVWHMESVGSGDNIVYRARTQGGEELTAKTRHGGIFPVIVKNPNLLNIISAIQTKTPLK